MIRANENQENIDDSSNIIYTKMCIDYIVDKFPFISPWDIKKFIFLDEIDDAFIDNFFNQCVISYPFGLNVLKNFPSTTFKKTIRRLKNDEKYHSLVYFAIGKVYLYYGLVERAYDYFMKFIELELNKQTPNYVNIIGYIGMIGRIFVYKNPNVDITFKERIIAIDKKIAEKLKILEQVNKEEEFSVDYPNFENQLEQFMLLYDFITLIFRNIDKPDLEKVVDRKLNDYIENSIIDPVTILKLTNDIIKHIKIAKRLYDELTRENLFEKSKYILKKAETGEHLSDEDIGILNKVGAYYMLEDLIIFYFLYNTQLTPLVYFFIEPFSLEEILTQILYEDPYEDSLLLTGVLHVTIFKKCAPIVYLAGAYYYLMDNFKKAIIYLEDALKLEFKHPFLYKILIKSYINRKSPGYRKIVFKYLDAMLAVIDNDDIPSAYFIIGTIIALGSNPKTLRRTIARVLKKIKIHDKKLLRIYNMLKDPDRYLSRIIYESTEFIKEYELI